MKKLEAVELFLGKQHKQPFTRNKDHVTKKVCSCTNCRKMFSSAVSVFQTQRPQECSDLNLRLPAKHSCRNLGLMLTHFLRREFFWFSAELLHLCLTYHWSKNKRPVLKNEWVHELLTFPPCAFVHPINWRKYTWGVTSGLVDSEDQTTHRCVSGKF